MPQDQFPVPGSQFSEKSDLAVAAPRAQTYSALRLLLRTENLPHQLQRMQISQQVFNLLVSHNLAEAFHFRSAVLHDVSHALVICGKSTLGQVLPLEDTLQARAFFAMRRIRFMATVAIVVIDFSAGGLLRVEAEFGVGLAALDIATGERDQRKCRHAGPETRRNPVREVHDDDGRGRIIRKS